MLMECCGINILPKITRALTIGALVSVIVTVINMNLAFAAERDPSTIAAEILDSETGVLEALTSSKLLPLKNEKLRCGTLISPKGLFVTTHCYFKKNSANDLYEILLESMTRARATPAIVNRSPRWVWLQFEVAFDVQSQSFNVKQSIQEHDKVSGTSYKGPQKYFRPRKCSALKGRRLVVTHRVDERGQVSDVQFYPEIEKKRLRQAILNCHLGMRYIPASEGGKPIASIVVEPFLQLRHNRMLEVKDRTFFNFGRR